MKRNSGEPPRSRFHRYEIRGEAIIGYICASGFQLWVYVSPAEPGRPKPTAPIPPPRLVCRNGEMIAD